MGKKKKAFIDKKDPQSHTFSLVHRSQRDPLAADLAAPQYVLAPVSTQQGIKLEKEGGERADESQFLDAPVERQQKFEKKADLAQHGIFYDDEYDYAKHLKQTGEAGAEIIAADAAAVSAVAKEQGLDIPADLFASAFEEDIGLLNRAAPSTGPRPDWDPEVIAALDDALDFEDPDNMLDDDFILQAESDMPEPEGNDYSDDDGGWDSGDDLRDIVSQFNNKSAGSAVNFNANGEFIHNQPYGGPDLLSKLNLDVETATIRSRFTEYSMSSSILPRSEVLQTHDSRFEKLFEQYDDDQIGALDEHEDEAAGNADIGLFEDVLDKFIAEELSAETATLEIEAKAMGGGGSGTALRAKLSETARARVHARGAARAADVAGAAEEEEDEQVADTGPIEIAEYSAKSFNKDWDCESILSTRSTLYNHPTRIVDDSKKIKVDPKTGLPITRIRSRGRNNPDETPEDASDAGEDSDEEEPLNEGVPRNRKETAEEKKERKQAIKDEKRMRRLEKKATKEAFRDEEKKQKVAMKSNPRHGHKIKQITS